MSAHETLTPELRAEVLRLEDDLRARVVSIEQVHEVWRAEYDAARVAERTAAAWEAWVDERVTLAAVGWVLTTVFIRFCEDNALVKPVWISGPRYREAIDAQQQFLRGAARTNPDVTDREWLRQAVDYLKSLPATTGLVDDTSPMWLVTPSGDAVTRLFNFWRERDERGTLVRDLRDPALDTRFLGDLYQEISEDAKKRYALLQTPVFVEEFILDRTLEPALNERRLEGFKMIDPTCGSGHFLLGGFQRLLDRWHIHAPGLDERERVQKALDSVYGVDINPFAVAIARFRMTVGALQACGLQNLESAPSFNYHIAAGDSLLHGRPQQEFDFGAEFSADKVAADFGYETENLEALGSILKDGQYDVVVGNPPYIMPKDKALNELYRRKYNYCKGKYTLVVPFMEKFFALSKVGEAPGWIGQITSNSFMKREFGVPLIEQYLPGKDLRFVIDSEGAWIPGHNMDGTPTVILIGRNGRPTASTVRAVLSKTRREVPSNSDGSGPYWRGIVDHLDDPGFESEWLSIADLDRDRLAKHPWTLTGGGAIELLSAIDAAAAQKLGDVADSIGITSFTLEDDVYVGTRSALSTRGVDLTFTREMVLGDRIRDWRKVDPPVSIFPYDSRYEPIDVRDVPALHKWMWPFRTNLSNSKMFGGTTKVESGLLWTEYGRLTVNKLRVPLSIVFAFVATHNHFVLDRGGSVFNRSAPVVKLPEGASEADHHSLLAVLNSSVTAFWLKQQSQPKGGAADLPWSRTYEFTGTTLQDFPLPKSLPEEFGRRLDDLAQEVHGTMRSLALSGPPTREALSAARVQRETLYRQMIAEQEELDWEVYRLFGLLDEDLTWPERDRPDLTLGQRAFEIAMARDLRAAEDRAWFDLHGSQPTPEIPLDWPSAYRHLVARRIETLQSHPFLRLLERPEHKRRWQLEPWERLEERILRAWILERLEDRRYWFDTQSRPIPQSIAALADEVARSPEIAEVLTLWDGRRDVSLASTLERLLAAEAVPFLAAYRYKESGLRKRQAWEHTWDLQRREDAGTFRPGLPRMGRDGAIPVPPKYTGADFLRSEYWSHRGKLDLAREPFVLYPNSGRAGDTTAVLGWAGWDYAQQALALATLIQSGEQSAWPEERLTPLVAGLSELIPWVEQWHSDPDPFYGGSSPAEFFSGLLDQYMAKLGATRESLAAWRPSAVTRGRKTKA